MFFLSKGLQYRYLDFFLNFNDSLWLTYLEFTIVALAIVEHTMLHLLAYTSLLPKTKELSLESSCIHSLYVQAIQFYWAATKRELFI